MRHENLPVVARLNPAQAEANRLMGGVARSLLLRGGSRCLSGDAVLDGQDKTIADLSAIGEPVRVLTSWGEQWAEAPFRKGRAALIEFVFVSGRRVRVTPDHRFWNGSAWVYARDVDVGDPLGCVPHTLVLERYDPLSISHDRPFIGGYEFDYVMRVEYGPEEDFYTLHVPGCEQYFANGLLHHNSGKTFLIVRAICIRAMKAPGSRHGIFRHRLNSVKASVLGDTFPKVMKLCFPGIPYRVDKQNSVVFMKNGSEIHFMGLDSADRTEKILGLEFATVYLNEASQISYQSRNMLLTRLAQKTSLKPKEYIDANPPSMSHWLYLLFEQKVEPKSGEPLAAPDNFATMQINPDANRANLTPEYIESLESLPERERRRFLFGEYQSAVEGALWTLDGFRRVAPAGEWLLPQLKRVVVSVDPSGASGKEDERSDEIGIVVCGLGEDGVAYVMEDATMRGAPHDWASRAVGMFDKWRADRIVAERNYGGAMVEAVIRSIRAAVPVKLVTASRGKFARAEPVAAFYDQGRVVHCGRFADLEDQMCQFSGAGYQGGKGSKSPDRADALIWCLTELLVEQQTAPAQWGNAGFSLAR